MIRVTLARSSFSGATLVLCICAALSVAASEALQKPAEGLLEEGIKLTAARADATATSDIFARFLSDCSDCSRQTTAPWRCRSKNPVTL